MWIISKVNRSRLIKGIFLSLAGRALCAALFVAVILLCCQTADALAAPRRIGVVLPSFRESRWGYDLQALRNAAERNNVDIIVRFAGNHQGQQNTQIKEIVTLGVDALIVVPDDVRGVAPAIAFARERKIPVISYDRLAEDCDLSAYVTFEQIRVGELMGRYLISVAPKGNYVLISGASQDSNAALFKEGAMKFIRPLIEKGDITVIEEGEAVGWKESSAQALMEKALAKTTNIAAVLAPNDDTARGVITALAAKKLDGKVPVTGQDATTDALERIASGQQGMTIFKDTSQLAKKAMQVAVGLIDQKPLAHDTLEDNKSGKVPTYVIPVMLVDKSRLPWLMRAQEFQ